MATVTIPLREFSPLVYANLHELEVVKNWTNAYSQTISELNKIIQGYGVGDMLGVALLHKHFNLHEDELLVREIEEDGIKISPFNLQKNPVLPFIWAFSKSKVNECFGCYPIEFVRDHPDLRRFDVAANAVATTASFRADYFRVLASDGATNVLGLGLNVGALYAFKPGHQLMETESATRGARTLRLQIRPEAEFEGKDVIQTLWI